MAKKDKDIEKQVRDALSNDPRIPEDLGLDWDAMDIQIPSSNLSSEDQEFDDFIRQGVEGHPELDAALSLDWEDMDIQTNKKKSKRRFIWWFFFGGLVFTAGILIGRYIDNASVSTMMPAEIPSEIQDIQEVTEVQVEIIKDKPDLQMKENSNASPGIQKQHMAGSNATNSNMVPSKPVKESIAKRLHKEWNSNIPDEPQHDMTRVEEVSKPQVVLTKNISDKLIAALPLNMLEYSNTAYQSLTDEALQGSLPNRVDSIPLSSNKKYGLLLTTGRNGGTLQRTDQFELPGTVESDLGYLMNVSIQKQIHPKVHLHTGLSYTVIHSIIQESRLVSKEHIQGTQDLKVTCVHFLHNNYAHYLGWNVGADYTLLDYKKFEWRAGISLNGNRLVYNEFKWLGENNDIAITSIPSQGPALNMMVIPSVSMHYQWTDRFSVIGRYAYTFNVLGSYQLSEQVNMHHIHSAEIGIGYHW